MEAKSDKKLRLLLIEDDEDDFVLLKHILSEIERQKFDLTWAREYDETIVRALNGDYDVCIMDYRLGTYDGLTLLREFKKLNFQAPVIMLTGYGDREVDLEAMSLGAADYLEKLGLTPDKLERSIRYAIDRSMTLKALIDSEAKLRRLSSKILKTQEDERKAIAKELHDSIGSSLTAIKYALEKKLSEIHEIKSSKSITLEQLIAMIRETMEETRRISSNLRPSILDDLGLLTAINSICREYQRLYERINIKTTLNIKESEIPDHLKIIIYRVLQEALNNIIKHSGADSVELSLGKTDNGIEIVIEDNGRGFDLEEIHSGSVNSGGTGIIGMSERVALSNGQFNISTGKGRKTAVRAFWPIS
ncbi:MAG: response regulator [Deltaproteobacteria bacterium]|nr:response regulator [Deltaproteobacteria bacterium]